MDGVSVYSSNKLQSVESQRHRTGQ